MKVATLNQTHPTYDAEALRRYRAMAEGGARWRENIKLWVFQRTDEPNDVYRDRLRLSSYNNYCGSILGILSGYLFSEAPKFNGLEGDYYEGLKANCDLRGTPFARWWRELFDHALIGKRSYAWIRLPSREPDMPAPQSLLDQERAGELDAYLTPFTPEEVIDWDEDRQGALTWIMARQVITDRADPTAPRTTTWRWTAITQRTVTVWEWHPPKDRPDAKPRPQDDAPEVMSWEHGSVFPVVRIDLPEKLWAMSLLYEPAVDHMRCRNDLTWTLHRGAHATLYLKSRWEADRPTIGAGYYIPLRSDDDIGYVEPGGATTALLAADEATKREEIYRVMNQMALSRSNDSTRIAASGSSKEQDWLASTVVMSAFADIVLGAMQETVRVIATMRTDEADDVEVSGLDGWHQTSLDVFLANASLAINASRMSPTFRKELAKIEAQRVLENATPGVIEAIRKEIDEAPDEDPMLFLGGAGGAPGTPPPGAKQAMAPRPKAAAPAGDTETED